MLRVRATAMGHEEQGLLTQGRRTQMPGLVQGRSLSVSQLLTFFSMSEKQHKAPGPVPPQVLSLSPASKLFGLLVQPFDQVHKPQGQQHSPKDKARCQIGCPKHSGSVAAPLPRKVKASLCLPSPSSRGLPTNTLLLPGNPPAEVEEREGCLPGGGILPPPTPARVA